MALLLRAPDALGAVSASLLVANNVVEGCGRGVEVDSVSAATSPRSAIVLATSFKQHSNRRRWRRVQVTTNASEVIVSGNLVTDIAADNGIFIGSTGGGRNARSRRRSRQHGCSRHRQRSGIARRSENHLRGECRGKRKPF